MLAVVRNHHRLPLVSRRVAAVIPRTSSPCSTYGSRAVATSSKTDRQDGESKSTSTSMWMKIKLLLPPAIFFCAGAERLHNVREMAEIAEQCESRLKMEVLEGSEIYEFSRESLKNMEFRKVKCRGVFDENKSILVLVNTPTPYAPFAYEYSLLTPFIPLPTHPQSVISPILVNRERVPRDWADDRKIEKLQSHKIVRDFPQKEKLSSASQPQPVEPLGRNILLRLQNRLIPSFSQPQPQPIELVGIIRSGVFSGWSNKNSGTIFGAVGLHPNATLYIQSIDDTSHETTIFTPYNEDRMLSAFAKTIDARINMIVMCFFAGCTALFKLCKKFGKA